MYVRLVEALCAEHGINLMKVREMSGQLVGGPVPEEKCCQIPASGGW